MSSIDSEIQRAKVTGTPGEAPDTQGVTAREAQSIISSARTQGVEEGEIFSSFASIGLTTLYQDAARDVRTKPAAGSSVPPDNADYRASGAISDLRRAYDAHRFTPGQIALATVAMDALGAAAASDNGNWTSINVGDSDRAAQLLTRAKDAQSIGRRMYQDAFALPAGTERSALVRQAREILDAAERLTKNDFVTANAPAGSTNAETVSAFAKELARVRQGLAHLS